MNKGTHVIVKYDANWADEMDIVGFGIFTREQWEALTKEVKKVWKKIGDSFSVNIGTNQEIDFESYDDWIGLFDIVDIDIDESALLHRLFDISSHVHGTGTEIINILDQLTDYAEMDGDDDDESFNQSDFGDND